MKKIKLLTILPTAAIALPFSVMSCDGGGQENNSSTTTKLDLSAELNSVVVEYDGNKSILKPSEVKVEKIRITGFGSEYEVEPNSINLVPHDDKGTLEVTFKLRQKNLVSNVQSKTVEIKNFLNSSGNVDKYKGYEHLVIENDIVKGAKSIPAGGILEIPDGVTSIAAAAFSFKAGNLNTVVGSSVTKNQITRVIIPDSVTTIGAAAFAENVNLESVVMSKKVNKISEALFEGCVRLKTINLPNEIDTIGNYAFLRCKALTKIDLPKNLTSLGSSIDLTAAKTFQGTGLTEITIPANVKMIPTSTFEGCESLSKVTLNSKLEKVSWAAFKGCTSLTEINLPENVKFIGKHAFLNCSNLAKVEMKNKVTEIKEGAFENVTALKNITLSTALTTLSKEAFKNSGITTIALPANLKAIEEGTFENCTALTKVTMGNNITAINSKAFYNCGVLNSINLSTSLVKIQNNAFENTTNLSVVTFPTTITLIDNGAFKNSGLVTLTVPGTLSNVEPESFMNCKKLTTVTFGTGWDNKDIKSKAFYGCDVLTTVTFASKVKNILKEAFFACPLLKEVSIHKGTDWKTGLMNKNKAFDETITTVKVIN
ncbi:leucine-rich repeat domain-containing protein [Mycoplasmopsis fermentans]|uniref:leucine-rich repeat domain-containing protein n=1 Tax=Mycoplasmopsis fermentans TaxID=2115 RepID=UPI0001E33062|nr:leucine-rich repeat domain-containing protein [Mycoplasmopsis fermentans]ADN68853.1 conserved hypothetical membrane associated protein [Mycoplasmopsis fermentans JER]